ncbi:hypothetical protein BDF14DRAFT_1808698, partial [Spinellus fusiger]
MFSRSNIRLPFSFVILLCHFVPFSIVLFCKEKRRPRGHLFLPLLLLGLKSSVFSIFITFILLL